MGNQSKKNVIIELLIITVRLREIIQSFGRNFFLLPPFHMEKSCIISFIVIDRMIKISLITLMTMIKLPLLKMQSFLSK